MKNGRVIYIIILGAVFFYLIFAMMRFGDGNSGRHADSVRLIIDKALVQAYALEGSYPAEIEHITQYGVILDRSRFFYYYEWFGSNIRPMVMVIER